MTEGMTRARARGPGVPPPREYTPCPRSRAGPARKEAAPTSPVLVRRSSVRFLASKRQIKEKWLHVHIDFCPQFAGCRGVGRSGWIGGSRVCGRTVGRLRVVAERETTNLCVPSSSSSFSASYSTSSSSSRYSSSLSLRLLRVSTGCFSLPLFLPTTPFTFLSPSLSPSCTLRLPSPAIHPLLSPFPFPSSVRRSLAHSLTPFAALPLLSASSPSSPLPVSLVVSLCLSSLFVSLFHPFPPRPFVPSSFRPPLTSLSCPPPVGFFFILLSLPPCPSLSVSLVLRLSFPSSLSVSPFSVLFVAPPHPSSTVPPSPLFRSLFFFPFAFTLRVSLSSPPPLSAVLVPPL